MILSFNQFIKMTEKQNIAVVDFQGFLIKGKNEFVLKELSFTYLKNSVNHIGGNYYHHTFSLNHSIGKNF